jgi:replicative DNA helicase
MSASQRVPPHAEEAERSVLGALLLSRDAMVEVADKLTAEMFYDRRHQLIYEAIESLYEEREPIDVVTVSDWLKKKKSLRQSGGAGYLSELVNSVPTAAHAVGYAKIIKDNFVKREMISSASKLVEMAGNDDGETAELLDQAEKAIFGLSQSNLKGNFRHIKDALSKSFDRLDLLHRTPGGIRGVPTGFTDLDNVLAGMQDSNLLILAARPGMGKTSLALNIAHFIGVEAKEAVGFFSLEMSQEELTDRLLVSQANIDAWKLKTGNLKDDDWSKISEAMGVLADAPIYVDDTPGISILEMRTKARRLQIEHGVKFIVVDYLQLATGGTKYESRVQEVGAVSQGLKNLARELKIPVLALAQLSRAIEQRGTKVPQLSDLRESGCLSGETLIYLPDSGEYTPIKDLMGKKDFNILSLNTKTWKLETSKVSKAFCTGKKTTYRLKTRLGREIKATANHKFLTIYGWKRLDQLSPGDLLALPRQLPSNDSETLSYDELALLGHLIGDGCTLPRHAIQYTTVERDLAEMVVTLAENIFGNQVKPRIHQEKGHRWYQVFLPSSRRLTHGVRSPISRWLDKMGVFGLRSYEKIIPELVFRQSEESVAAFLRHLWATDGSINLSLGKKHYANIYFASSSKKLAQGVQSLLLRLEINARLSRHEQPGKGRDQFHVHVSGKDDVIRFLDKIGAIGEHKGKMAKRIYEYINPKTANTNRDIVPHQVWRMFAVPAMQKYGVSGRQLQANMGQAYCGSTLYKQNLSRDRAKKVASIVHSQEMRKLSRSDVYWDQVELIEFSGEEKVYDLTVPGNHNFVANNIIAHNSIEQDADVVMFLYREDDDNLEDYKLSVSKHRNGPLRTIDLKFKGDRIRFFGLDRSHAAPPPAASEDKA